MDLKQFYKSVEDIVLYPGDLNGLNLQEQVNGSGRVYELMPQKDAIKYIKGSIIPKPSELKEMVAAVQGASGKLDKLCSNLGLDEDTLGDMSGMMLEQMLLEAFEAPEFQNTDLRLKAKEAGADGLVHFQLYNTNDQYMGVPVKLKK